MRHITRQGVLILAGAEGTEASDARFWQLLHSLAKNGTYRQNAAHNAAQVHSLPAIWHDSGIERARRGLFRTVQTTFCDDILEEEKLKCPFCNNPITNYSGDVAADPPADDAVGADGFSGSIFVGGATDGEMEVHFEHLLAQSCPKRCTKCMKCSISVQAQQKHHERFH